MSSLDQGQAGTMRTPHNTVLEDTYAKVELREYSFAVECRESAMLTFEFLIESGLGNGNNCSGKN